MNAPHGIVVDPSGTAYITDSGNNRVEIFGRSGGDTTPPASVTIRSNSTWATSINWLWTDPSDSDYYKTMVYINGVFRTNRTKGMECYLATGLTPDTEYTISTRTVDYSGNMNTTWVNITARTSAALDTTNFYSGQFGSGGTGNSQFSEPWFIARDSGGFIYVADRYNNRIQKFNPDGTYLFQWGEAGTGDGQFNSPIGITIDSSDNIYVSDYSNNRIQKFNATGAFLTKWGSAGSGDGEISQPLGIAVDSSGNVYVVEQGNTRIQKFTSGGVFQIKWGTTGSLPGQFNNPHGVAVDAAGSVYVTDYGNNRIQKFSPNGLFISQWGGFGYGDGQFNGPVGVTVDSKGIVYVTDRANNRVQVFNTAGEYITKWGDSGVEDGQLRSPQGILTDLTENTYVVDSVNNRVQIFSRLGADITPPASVTNLTNNTAWATLINWNWTDPVDADYYKTMVYIDGSFRTNRTKGMQCYLATGLNPNTSYTISTRTVDYTGNINTTWVNSTAKTASSVDTTNFYAGQFGTAGTGNGQFSYPWHIARDAGGEHIHCGYE